MFNNGDLYNPRFRLDWNLYTLYSLAEWINGKAFRKTDYSEKGYPVIKIAELNRGIDGNTQYAPKDKFDEKYQIKKSDILFAWSGNPKTSINSFRYTYERGWLNQHIFKVIPKESIDKNYLYYLLKYLNPNFEMMASNKQTTGLGHVTKNDLKNIQVRIPKISDQRIISEVLSSFDNKIENNNAIIANLEEQAQAIFKSWFVDFEPFQDGEFVESDLGDIPKGWSIESLGDIVNIYDSERKPLSQMVRQGMERNYPYYGANGVIDYVEDYLFDGKYLLLGEDGTVQTNEGYPILNYIEEKFWVSNHAHIMTGDKISTEFLYVSIKRRNIRDIITGAVQQKINQRNLKSIKLVIPESNILINFQNIIEPIFEKVLVLKKSNKKLEETRDILLPKLMSGEIRVEEAIEVEEM